MEKKISLTYLLPSLVVGCFVATEGVETVFFITARFWIHITAIEIFLQATNASERNGWNWHLTAHQIHSRAYSSAASICSILLLKYSGHALVDNTSLPLTIVYCLCKFSEKDEKEKAQIEECIGYGAGMACSFFEGYLTYILPNDGAKWFGFEETINLYESKHSVRFPVKKLFLVITKSLYSPPSLHEFNKTNKRLPYLEGCVSLEEHIRDVAGVRGRIYKNSAYMVHRPGGEPVYLAAECATPLYTLHRVKQRRALYQELAEADFDAVVKEFCSTLERILETSRECHRKCVLVHYDDTDPSQNLAEILLEKIEEIEPNYEDLINIVD